MLGIGADALAALGMSASAPAASHVMGSLPICDVDRLTIAVATAVTVRSPSQVADEERTKGVSKQSKVFAGVSGRKRYVCPEDAVGGRYSGGEKGHSTTMRV